jgi:hypothetical protein
MGMALFSGISPETTENIDGTWCGNLLQITDALPDGYSVINCCLIWNRADYLYKTYGLNDKGLLFKDANGELYVGAGLNIYGKRSKLTNSKVEETEKNIRFIAVDIE